MSHLKKFSYPDISRRWITYTYVFLLFFILSFLITSSIFTYKQFLPYYRFTALILTLSIFALFIGNLAGRFIYSFINRYFIINLLLSILFVLSVCLYYFKGYIPGINFNHFDLYLKNRYLAYLIILAPSFLAGIVNSYFLKICSGDFVDEKNLLNQYHIAFFSSIAAAIFCNYACHSFEIQETIYSSILCSTGIILITFSVLIKFPFKNETLLAKHYIDDDVVDDSIPVQRDDLLFTYSNFSFIIIYILLGYVAFIKFFHSIYFNNLLYTAVILASLTAGYISGGIKKQPFWYVFSEMLYPVFFLLSLYLLYLFEGRCSIWFGLLFAAVPGLIFGFSLSSTVYNIYKKYDHQRRFNILNFSLFILPFPIMFASAFLHFSNTVFFIILYTLALVNLVVPGIFIFNLKIGYTKKIIYFFLALTFIPAIILFHFYFKIPVSSQPFFSHTENYQILSNTNFNLPYITERGEIKVEGMTSFYLSESTIRNHKRAAASTLLFIKNDSRGLIIDSNQHFYRNPVFGLFKNSVCLDVIPDEFTDRKILPESGRQLYIPVKTELLHYLSGNVTQYDFIIDYPNILDQNFHTFRCSYDYYSMIKKHISQDGKYAIIIDMQFADPEFVNSTIQNLGTLFKNNEVLLFSNILLIVSSDSQNAVSLDAESINRLNNIIKDEDTYGLLFYSAVQPLNNILFSNLEDFKKYLKTGTPGRLISIKQAVYRPLSTELQDYYLKKSPDLKTIVSNDILGWKIAGEIFTAVARQKTILDYIKKIEFSESINSYASETDYLFQLKKYSPYYPDLKIYIDKVFSVKEKYYLNEATRLEKEKKWDDATVLYNAIITINSDNFDANYRLGLLYITIQDLTNAFTYLDKALKLNKNHPQVLYQMGVLMFSSNKIKEAIDYFEKAKELNLNIYMLYMYLGLSYEQIQDYPKAKEYYEKAIILDPNDTKLKSLLSGVEYKIKQNQPDIDEGKKTNMIDDEQDINMSIPVNKKAVNARLQDE